MVSLYDYVRDNHITSNHITSYELIITAKVGVGIRSHLGSFAELELGSGTKTFSCLGLCRNELQSYQSLGRRVSLSAPEVNGQVGIGMTLSFTYG
jgi:hypothetical protein